MVAAHCATSASGRDLGAAAVAQRLDEDLPRASSSPPKNQGMARRWHRSLNCDFMLPMHHRLWPAADHPHAQGAQGSSVATTRGMAVAWGTMAYAPWRSGMAVPSSAPAPAALGCPDQSPRQGAFLPPNLGDQGPVVAAASAHRALRAKLV